MFVNREKLEETDFRDKFGSLYKDIDLKNPGSLQLLYVTTHCVRRIITVVLVFTVSDKFYIQLWVALLLTILQYGWQVIIKPFETKSANWQHNFNEILTLAIVCVVFSFSDATEGPEQRFMLGWVFLAGVGIMCVANILLLILAII